MGKLQHVQGRLKLTACHQHLCLLLQACRSQRGIIGFDAAEPDRGPIRIIQALRRPCGQQIRIAHGKTQFAGPLSCFDRRFIMPFKQQPQRRKKDLLPFAFATQGSQACDTRRQMQRPLQQFQQHGAGQQRGHNGKRQEIERHFHAPVRQHDQCIAIITRHQVSDNDGRCTQRQPPE